MKELEVDLLEIIKADYQRFPENQTFEIYAKDVYFKDPLNEFRGVKKYRKMIGLLDRFFSNIDLKTHNIEREEAKPAKNESASMKN